MTSRCAGEEKSKLLAKEMLIGSYKQLFQYLNLCSNDSPPSIEKSLLAILTAYKPAVLVHILYLQDISRKTTKFSLLLKLTMLSFEQPRSSGGWVVYLRALFSSSEAMMSRVFRLKPRAQPPLPIIHSSYLCVILAKDP